MGRAAIALTVAAALTASACPTLAEAAGWSMTVPTAGYCVPAPDDGNYVPRVVGALGVGAVATRPIAILDTGVDPSVPQLAGRVGQGYDALTGAPVSDDPSGHGTEVAGLAAASGPGVLGVAPASPILPIRIFDANRASSAGGVAKGIALAVARGAGVIVVGGSGPLAGASEDDVAMVAHAVDAAFAKGVLVVAAMGDDTAVNTPTIPAALPHVLVAGAATATPSRSAAVNTGPWLDLLVPAEGIEGPLPSALCVHGFGFSTGSSFAAPSLGAAAALVTARRPGLTVQQYFELIRRAGTDIGQIGRDDDSGYGILNVATALSAAPQPKETSPEVDDDPFWVRGPYAKAHPSLLTKTKLRFKANGSVSPAKDPSDVYRVQLTKRERMVVTVAAADPTALLELAILGPRAGDFDVSEGLDENRLVATGGLSNDPQLEITASATGTYYIAVESAEAVDADDPTAVAADLEPYQVSAYKQHRTVKKKKK
ncbi:MAG TPA: S8 family serine peptidase [Baekduia sp.]|uniref:S8 family serine peptidase n=1 Tax=Baekduia sp. TaxID=2600305 RepID=UPI002BFD7EF7|nr:S8 family serine peptidase [Baekduia sp.]HMJ35445.1 S8 family serine peptidase [Baekduia sp.]